MDYSIPVSFKLDIKNMGDIMIYTNYPVLDELEISGVSIAGEIFGSFEAGCKISRTDTIKKIKSISRSEEKLKKFLRVCIGKFYVIIRTGGEICLYSSPSSEGVFYFIGSDSVCLSNNEKEIYGMSSLDKIDDMEILNIIQTKGAIKSPFYTIFENVKRAPGGVKLKISGRHIKQEIYILKERNEIPAFNREDEYDELKNILNSTADLISDTITEMKKIVMFSGGVDSAALLNLFKERDSATSGFTWDKGHLILPKVTRSMSYIIDADNVVRQSEVYPPKNNEDIEKIDNFYGNSLVRVPYGEFFPILSYVKQNNIDLPFFILGQNMDSGYVIDGFRPSFGTVGLRYRKEMSDSNKKRSFFTIDTMQSIIDGSFNGNISESFLLSPHEYMKSMVIPSVEHVVPFSDAFILPDSLADLKEDYIEYKIKTVLEPVIGKKDELFDIDAVGFNHLVRVLKYYRFIQGAIRVVTQDYRVLGYNVNLFANEGPLLDYFMRYELNMEDVHYPKRLLYRYFKEKYQIDFMKLIKKSQDNIANKIYRRIFVQQKKINKVQNELLLSYYKKVLLNSENCLLDVIGSPSIKDYILTIFDDLKEDRGNKLNEIERIISVELFLRNIFK